MQVTPNYRKSVNRWVVDTRPTKIKKATGDKGEQRKFSSEAEADAYAKFVNSAQDKGGAITFSAVGTVQSAIEIFCLDIDRRVHEKKISYKHGVNSKTNANGWSKAQVRGKLLGHIKCINIKAKDVEFLISNLTVKFKTQTEKLRTLKQVFDVAKKEGWISENVIRDVRHEDSVYNLTEEEVEEGTQLERIDPAQIGDLIRVAEQLDPEWCDGLAVSFAAQTGLRFGEQASLKWKFIDFENKCVNVRTSSRKVEGGFSEAGIPKTSKSRRNVFLTSDLIQSLKAWKLRSPKSSGDDRVFITREGTTQVSSDNWRNRILHSACDKLGDFDHITWHQLRHIFASICVDVFKPTVDAKHASWTTIARYLGHKTERTTFNLYNHWINNVEYNSQLADKFESAIKKRSEG